MLRFFLFHSHRPFAVLTRLEAPTKKKLSVLPFSAYSVLSLRSPR
jgi:hypothetical protein